MSDYIIKTKREEMQITDIKALLEQSAWANTRDIQTIQKAIDHSLCFGAFLEEGGKQIGFARVITDYTTMYYICDVIVDEAYRGNGVGKALLDAIHANKEVSSLKGVLATYDAHDFYRKYGFVDGENTLMTKPRQQ